jgi:hypothetical protein
LPQRIRSSTPGAAPVARLELGQVGVVLVGDEHLETEPLVVSEGELQ